MEKETLSVVVAGHKDHGKSTLIGRLLLDAGRVADSHRTEVMEACRREGREFQPAFLTDRLLDERHDGLTLCAGRASFGRGDRRYEFVDSPGHRALAREALMGATIADVAILVVDVSEGIAEQTRRHVTYFSLVGIHQLIVVINKMDVVCYCAVDYHRQVASLTPMIEQAGFGEVHFVPASALKGKNVVETTSELGWYEGPTVVQSLETARLPLRGSNGLRFPIQDMYVIDGEDMLVGRVEAGRARVGDEVVLLPEGRRSVIRSLHCFGRTMGSAGAGESIGIRLAGDATGTRGTVLCGSDDLPVVRSRFRARLLWTSDQALRAGERLLLRCTTQETECTIDSIEAVWDTASPGRVDLEEATLSEHRFGIAMIHCQRAVVIESYGPSMVLGRFTLEREGRVAAGGLVVEVSAGECV